MGQKFTPKLSTTDWNEEWKQLQKHRKSVDDASYWDKRAATFKPKDYPGSYVEQFIKLADLRPKESVLDMGCGTGALSVPLAKLGHPVLACDFSEGMLTRMDEEIAEQSVTGITKRVMSWSDDWSTQGIENKSVDVAIASRSIATDDIKTSLLKLNNVAKRRACVTLTTGYSPRANEKIFQAIGLEPNFGRDYLYAFNILAHEGLYPEVSYITSTRESSFESFEQGRDYYYNMVNQVAEFFDEDQMKHALKRLDTWLKEHLTATESTTDENEHGDEGKKFYLDMPHIIRWAFITWDTSVSIVQSK